ncbi:MAG: VPLPA-CTERM-specific exosortase XrtD [Alphaproteobacteria bacterium]|nr:VPLPA-CTERM-specific exosortase XrtD [Alphaproteobacteria bacterium]
MKSISAAQVAPAVPQARSLSSRAIWLASALVVIGALSVVFRDGLIFMAEHWHLEEYSHAWLIPFIALALIWQKLDAVADAKAKEDATRPQGWLQRLSDARVVGVAVIVAGLLIGLLGELSTIYLVIQYGFLVTVYGVFLLWAGWRGIWLLIAPLAYLVFMIPLPDFMYANLSAKLQLISSELGVAFVRLFGIPVFLEGNVIDLGIYKLQVVEACSGLRYLFPLMSFGFLCAYLYMGPFWHRAVLFLSTVPITILMNSFRIGVIGVFVDRWGIEQAEGALHFFEGWVIFMACVAILFLEIWLFARFSRPRRSLSALFRIDLPKGTGGAMIRLCDSVPRRPWFAAVAVLLLAAGLSSAVAQRVDLTPDRMPLAAFPLQFDDWQGKRKVIPRNIVKALRVSDYMSADYAPLDNAMPVNLYVAYYASQRKGEAVHSPRSCIPGGGWEIVDLVSKPVEGLKSTNGEAVKVNRVVIARGGIKQVVYYWFLQRGRSLTNEYHVKWYLFWDGVTRQRTDGALIRLVTPLREGESADVADRRLSRFLHRIHPIIDRYIPA